jgi:HPt (histidine-containing phosphotransfer) domain-containing protein
LPDVPGTQLTQALARCGNQASLLRKVLRQFHQQWPGLSTELAGLVARTRLASPSEPADWAPLRAWAHRQKGTLGNLGLSEAAAQALALEQCLSSEPRAEHLAQQADSLCAAVQAALDGLQDWLVAETVASTA